MQRCEDAKRRRNGNNGNYELTTNMDPNPTKTFECRLLLNNVLLRTFGDDKRED